MTLSTPSLDTKRFPEIKFLQVWEEMEVGGCQIIRRSEGMAEQIVLQIPQFPHCQHAFVRRYVVLVQFFFFPSSRQASSCEFDIQLVKKVRIIFACNCSAIFKIIN